METTYWRSASGQAFANKGSGKGKGAGGGKGQGGAPTIDLPTLFGANGGAWYEFTDTATIFSDVAGTTPANVNDTVARINDKSPRANNLTNATAGQRPTSKVLSGLRYGEFVRASSQKLFRPSGTTFGDAAGMVACGVFETTDGVSEQFLISADFSPTTREFAFGPSGGFALSYLFSAANGVQSALSDAAAVPTSTKVLLTVWLSGGTNWVFRLNKAQIKSGTVAAAMGSKGSDITVGASSAASDQLAFQSHFQGKIYSAMCLSKAVTLAEVVQIENYLSYIGGLG